MPRRFTVIGDDHKQEKTSFKKEQLQLRLNFAIQKRYKSPMMIARLLAIIMLLMSVTATSSHGEMMRVKGMGGIFNFAKANNFTYGAEVTLPSLFLPLGLNFDVGFLATDRRAVYGYAAIERAFYVDDDWRIIPSLAMGYYEQKDDKDLGFELNFKSGGEVAYQFARDAWAGISAFHISNASLSSHNPGTELFVFTLTYDVSIIP